MATRNFISAREYIRNINIPLFILVCLFALSSWIDINGIWVELPLFVRSAPESWKLASYIVVVIQIANIGPLLFTIAKTISPTRVKEYPFIIVVIFVAFVSCLLLIFFWESTTLWAGSMGKHSTGILVLSLFLSLVDCTSSVLYITYISSFNTVYMTALFVGEGLSGLLPGILGLAQLTDEDQWVPNKWENVTKNSTSGLPEVVTQVVGYSPIYAVPRFSVEVFLGLITILLFISLASFLLIHYLPYFEKYRNEKQKDDEKKTDEENEEEKKERRVLLKGVLLLIITAWLNGLTNGVLPALQTYSARSYSNLIYNLHVKLSVLINPLACFITLGYTVKHITTIVIFTLLGTVLSAYQIALADMSPDPPAKGVFVGEFFAVLTQVLLVAIFSYTKVCIAIIMSLFPGKHWLLFYGFSTQVGSFIGAIITFGLVNFTTIFQEAF